jgi:hypothetical protein
MDYSKILEIDNNSTISKILVKKSDGTYGTDDTNLSDYITN